MITAAISAAIQATGLADAGELFGAVLFGAVSIADVMSSSGKPAVRVDHFPDDALIPDDS
jgi:hypothetical protein